jgi:hypothetical protein
VGQHTHYPPQSALLYAGQRVARVKGQGNAQNKKALVIDISFYGYNARRGGQHLPTLKVQ